MAFGRSNKQEDQPQPASKDMAKPTVEERTGGELTVTDKGQAPAFLRGREQQGAGASTKREDNKVPMVSVLQTNSPQVNKRNEAYIEGAEPGDFWMQNAPRPVVKGEAGFEFQPCSFVTKFVEWIHRDDGGGFADAYDDARVLDEAKEGQRTILLFKAGKEVGKAKEGPDRKDPTKIVWIMPNGNYVKETKYYTGFARFNNLTMPYVIPMSSSFLTPSKNWMGMITSKMTDAGRIYDIWTSWYRLTTKLRKKKENEWFVPNIHDLGFIETEDEDARGKVLHEAVMSGEKTIDHSDEGRAGTEEQQESGSDRM